jgi:2-desacetyl-2-hydroxyethyl bacteriochlorophyllide A dehydrogenase
MKALVCTEPFQFDYIEIPEPVSKSGYTILKISRIGICGTDLHAYEGTQPYFNYPRILGHELAGEIVETKADGFSVGEMVTFIPYFACGTCIACRNGKSNCCTSLKVCGVHIDGGMAEYYAVPDETLVKSNGLSADELALVEPLSIGAHGIRRAQIQPDEFVLVIGAGPIGLGTMEFARIAGGKVIAMDINAHRLQFCVDANLAKYTVNPSEENVYEKLLQLTGGDMPTVVIDATGSLKAINKGFEYISHAGRYVLIGLQKGEISVSHPEFHKREATLMSSRNATREDFNNVIRSIAEKKVNPSTYITHRTNFQNIKNQFSGWLDPANGVIKAMVYF